MKCRTSAEFADRVLKTENQWKKENKNANGSGMMESSCGRANIAMDVTCTTGKIRYVI